jgi:diphthamide synthase (EF-2-diphthine--ammonia ligase)
MMEKIVFSWSSGKDSSLALYELMKQGICDIKACFLFWLK